MDIDFYNIQNTINVGDNMATIESILSYLRWSILLRIH